MSDEIFPTSLPGIKWDRVRRPRFKTSIYEALSGAERRIRHRPEPKYEVELSYEVLRERGLAELQRLLAFYLDRSGPFDSFLFLDPYLRVSSNSLFAVADGTTTIYQLTRLIDNRSEAVHNPDLATLGIGRQWFPAIAEDAEFWPDVLDWPDPDEYEPAPGSWTLLPNGRIQFATAPPAGKRLLWSGRYYHRARFADDTLDYTEFMHRLFSLRSLKLVMSLRNIL